MSPEARRSQSSRRRWRPDVAKQLKLACGNLADAAREVRDGNGTRDADTELGILAEEVIDLATRGLVVLLRIAEPEHERGAADHHAAHAAHGGAPKVLGLSLGKSSKRDWTAPTVARLEDAVEPLDDATRILDRHKKEPIAAASLDDVLVLREEVMDVTARLVGADSRVATEPSKPSKPKSPLGRAAADLSRRLGGWSRSLAHWSRAR